MPQIAVLGASQISYAVLKDYHFTAKAIYDTRLEQSQPMEQEFKYEIELEAESEDEAKEIFMAYLTILNEYEIPYHSGFLIYITQNILNFEGRYIDNNGEPNYCAYQDLTELLKLLNIQKEAKYNKLSLEIKSRSQGNSKFNDYSILTHPEVIKNAVEISIVSLFNILKANTDEYSVTIADRIKSLETPDISVIKELCDETSAVKRNPFNVHLLYTVCSTLHRYLNDWSPLNPDKVFLTNAQANVIYQTCKLHNLINIEHYVKRDAENYIRTILTNKLGYITMLGSTKQSYFY